MEDYQRTLQRMVTTFSATYKAYGSYDERMKHKPEDLDIVEWHYLITYFGCKKFKVCTIL
jgi:hypothetical protein